MATMNKEQLAEFIKQGAEILRKGLPFKFTIVKKFSPNLISDVVPKSIPK